MKKINQIVSTVLLKFGIILAGVFSAGTIQAQQIQLGTVSYGGTACPANTASVAVSDSSSNEISVLFDGFVIESGAATGRRLDRKSCSLVIPVRIPAGFTVALAGNGGDGFFHGVNGSIAKINHEIFFAGSLGARTTQVLKGAALTNFKLFQTPDSSRISWSPCGASVNLRANISVITQGDALVGVENLSYKVLWRRCQ